jgi:hypothetical protein
MESFLNLINLKKCSAYRSIPTAYPRKHLFNEEINSGDDQDKLIDWANASSGISHARSVSNDAKDTWHKYGDPENVGEFLFDKVNLPASRFTDGSFPVWYGAEDSDTSLMEIEFHLKVDTQAEANSGFIDYERAMCIAVLEMKKNVDVKSLAKSLPNYAEKASYSDCLREFDKIKKQGATSLRYLSARNSGKECYAVTEREEILSTAVTKFFHLRVYTDPAKATDVAEIILEQ